jgi:hypothetical protein
MENVYLNGENSKYTKSLRKKATNQYLMQNCQD